jgi:hypothetical protein
MMRRHEKPAPCAEREVPASWMEGMRAPARCPPGSFCSRNCSTDGALAAMVLLSESFRSSCEVPGGWMGMPPVSMVMLPMACLSPFWL